MSQLVKAHGGKLMFAASCVAVAAGLAWTWRRQLLMDEIVNQSEIPVLGGPAPEPVPFNAMVEEHAWLKPAAQSEDGAWVYEIFTPPEIYYHAAARSFAVTPPHYSAEATETVFELELLAVKLAPYRLQLMGYFGVPGDYLAAFVSSELRETLLAREGRHFEELGLTFKRFDVRRIAVETDTAGPVYDIVALAVLHDERMGGEVVLDNRTMKLTDTALAVFRAPDGQGEPRQLQEGDIIKEGEANYRIERIQFSPPEVVVARSTPGLAVPEKRVLRPTEAKEEHAVGKTSPLESIAAPSGQSVATQHR